MPVEMGRDRPECQGLGVCFAWSDFQERTFRSRPIAATEICRLRVLPRNQLECFTQTRSINAGIKHLRSARSRADRA